MQVHFNPDAAVQGVVFPSQPVLTMLDQYGNIQTTETNIVIQVPPYAAPGSLSTYGAVGCWFRKASGPQRQALGTDRWYGGAKAGFSAGDGCPRASCQVRQRQP
eukprot:78017-Rhodomonas_salina.3